MSSSGLALKIPPPMLAVLAGAAMYASARATPWGPVGGELVHADVRREAGLAFFAVGIAVGVGAVGQFLARGASVAPHAPAKTRTLVTGGLYRWSRNPMYLALGLCLAGYAARLGEPLALVCLAGFVAAANELQIKPEEAILEEKFGEAYRDYKRRTRRWI
ncbi:MAG: methyltransferase family protein [Parvularculaceae bacterium]